MNERVVKNPNFKNNGDFHKSLAAKSVGVRDWPNTHTEVEYLGNSKFAASIGVGHRVFFDKADGNKPKKHKLTNERPGKDYVLIQGAKCCVEVYPYYAKYFDVQHEEVRLYEERWVVQRLFKTAPQEEWRDVDAYNPVMEIKEGDSRVSVTITYQTDYGKLIVRYAQGDGNNLAHHVLFVNESGGTETFRVLQRWAGIVGGKCNGKDIPLDIDTPEEASHLTFHSSDKPAKQFNITANIRGMLYETVNEETGEIIEQEVQDPITGEWETIQTRETRLVRRRKTEKCLQLPVKVESHAQGMKVDFVFERWTLAPTEVLTIGSEFALDFNGTDNYVDLNYGVGAALNGAPAITFEAWIKNDVLPGAGELDFIFGTRIAGAFAGLDVYLYGSALRIGGRSKQADSYQKKETPFTTIGQWRYIVGILDFANDRIKIYLDGQEALDEAAVFGNATYTRGTPSQEDRLGQGPAMTADQYFDGVIDEVRISKVVRTPEEILATWNNGSGVMFEVDANTVALYHMDYGVGSTIYDETANNNHGTIIGASWTDGFPFGDDCPDTATLDDPTEDGFVEYDLEMVWYNRSNTATTFNIGKFSVDLTRRGYVEWDIISIPDGSTITNTVFKYHGYLHNIDCHIHEMVGTRPSTQPDDNTGNQAIYDEAGAGTVYADPDGFPEVGTGKEVDLGASADSDLESQLSLDWFAIGIQSDDEGTTASSIIFSEEKTDAADPKPTLYVEYTPPAPPVGLENKSANMAAKMVAAGLL